MGNTRNKLLSIMNVYVRIEYKGFIEGRVEFSVFGTIEEKVKYTANKIYW
jgi:hypothetical protein